ncbi:EAL domain-containing protein [Undibacterium sp.]|uniref:bifunctional diguanylate cyclase/phosphodiesterase n=1 Tax=Undibacterium sp. TaxID=1914977 RepID=UPI0037531993
MTYSSRFTSLFYRLETRIVLAFIVLLLLLQITAFFYITRAIDANARAAVHVELQTGERIFKNLLVQNAQKLSTGARILAADFAFRDAVSLGDQLTISSVLENHGKRIDSAMSLLVGLDHQIVAQSPASSKEQIRKTVDQLAAQGEEKGTASEIATLDGKPFQFVIVPMKAPNTIAWIVMAFPLDENILVQMKKLSSLDSSIFTKDSAQKGGQIGAQTWQLNASTFDVKSKADFEKINPQELASSDASNFKEVFVNNDEFSTLVLPLVNNEQVRTSVILYRSVSAAVAAYQSLKFKLLALMLIGIILTIVASVLFARRLVGPLMKLTVVAKQLGKGDYEVAIDTERKDEIGELALAFSHMRKDIAHREEAISRLAYWDSLTQLPNRVQFLEFLQKAIVQSSEQKQECHVLMMDLDRFKVVNDVMGHQFGDVLLNEVAKRLSTELGVLAYQPARLGGDEFALVLPCSSSQQAQALAHLILKLLERPISIDDQTVDLGAGIGISAYPTDGSDASTLLVHAEVAMYAAKASRSGAMVYRPEIDQSSQSSLSLLSDLRMALETNAFRLFAQPKVELQTNRVIAVEALVRWVHPERGMVFPDHFIPFAEQTGFIRLLTLWVLEQSAAACKSWLALGLKLKVSVNLSTRDLLDQELPAKIQAILSRHNLTPENFCLEITESAIMDDPIRAQQTLEHLSNIGFDLSIDDFGTGYSSLAYLKRLPVNELKIDKSFVLNMEKDADDTKIVRSTIDLGHNMGLRVVAEGVENLAIMQLLTELGCDQAQGYFMSRPIHVDQIFSWVQTWNKEKNIAM